MLQIAINSYLVWKMEWWSSQLVVCLPFSVWFSTCTLNNNNQACIDFFSKTLCTCRHWIRLTKPPAWQSLSSLWLSCHLEWRQWSTIMLQTLHLGTRELARLRHYFMNGWIWCCWCCWNSKYLERWIRFWSMWQSTARKESSQSQMAIWILLLK